jgi:hypothetical protein
VGWLPYGLLATLAPTRASTFHRRDSPEQGFPEEIAAGTTSHMPRYREERVLAVREQIGAMQEPSLVA